MQHKDLIKHWLPVFLYIILIYYLSSLHNPAGLLSEKTGIKFYSITPYIYHMLEFGLLSFLFWRALKNSNSENPHIHAISFSILYAIFDEIHQIFVPTRVFSFIDISFNVLGILSVQSIIIIVHYYKRR